MQHLNKNRKLGRKKGPRKALLKSLVHNLITNNLIESKKCKRIIITKMNESHKKYIFFLIY